MPLTDRATRVTEQAAIPGEHLESQVDSLTRPEQARLEMFALRMLRECRHVSLPVGLILVVQGVATVRMRHMTHSVPIKLLPSGGAECLCGRGKRRAHARQKAFIFTVPADGMLIEGLAKLFPQE